MARTTMTLCVLAALLLVGADACKSDPQPPPPESPYCYGAPTALKRVSDFVGEQWSAIIGGEESTDRRATLRMRMSGGSCTGVALGPHTVLTAAHCTVGEDKVTVALGGYSEPPYFDHVLKTEHPEYLQYLYGGNWDLNKRQSDVAVLRYEADRSGETLSIPGPYVNKIFDPENQEHASRCLGFIAQGWGKWEEPGLSLRETPYDIDEVSEKLIITVHEPGEGRICFGDSGGPLYAEMDNGELWLVGLTRTTGSRDCSISSTHVRLSPYFDEWLQQTIISHEP